jgi:hypothetical protein
MRSRWLAFCPNTLILIVLIQQPEPSGSKAGESRVRNRGRGILPTKHLTLMLCRVLLRAVNLRQGTDGFTSPPKEVRATDFFIAHKNPLSSAGPEPATESPGGPVACRLTARPLRASHICYGGRKTYPLPFQRFLKTLCVNVTSRRIISQVYTVGTCKEGVKSSKIASGDLLYEPSFMKIRQAVPDGAVLRSTDTFLIVASCLRNVQTFMEPGGSICKTNYDCYYNKYELSLKTNLLLENVPVRFVDYRKSFYNPFLLCNY